MHRGPLAEIDLSALERNLRSVRNMAGKSAVIAVVKADAYGHGSVEVAQRLARSGVARFAVAYTEEAKQLRKAGITAGIIVLFDQTEACAYFDYDLIPVIRDLGGARVFAAEAVKRQRKIPVHIKIDTGMGRLGFMPEQAVDHAVEIAGYEGLVLEGLLSHFSEADLVDRTYTLTQLKIFEEIRDAIELKTGLDLVCHTANSAAIFSLPETLFDAVRPGIALYGCPPFQEITGLEPVMKIRTRIIALRDLPSGSPVSYGRTFITRRKSRIAVVPVGYADGYDRRFSNNAEMLIKGFRVPVVGRVCMDLSMLDVTDVPEASEGDEVVVMGSQGRDAITASELAGRIDTIPYEILTALGSRSTKEYIH